MIYSNTDKEIMEEIKKKAIEIFASKGYAATKISDIADGLSVSRGPIYYYYQDKFGLYTAAYNHFEEELLKIHEEIFATEDSFMMKIENVIFEFAKHISHFGHNFFFRIKELPELQEISQRYDRMNQKFYDEKLSLIKEGQASGAISSALTAEEILKGIYIIYLGILESMNTEILSRDREEEMRTWIHLLLEGFRNKLQII